MKTYSINLIRLVGDAFDIEVVRTVEVEAEDGILATFKAAEQITEDEASSVFAETPTEL